jgi:23S rRNA (adenine2503-C2)-methyltransferase
MAIVEPNSAIASPDVDVVGLTPEELSAALGVEPYHAKQIFRWIHHKRVLDFGRMTDLSKALRERLISEFRPTRLTLASMEVSETTNTRKALLALPDGETVESVMIPSRERVTLCVSTQVGCPIKCSFCATGLSGYARNLSAGEIVAQALYLLQDVDLAGRTPNVVFMGMGEPFRNYDATMKAIRLLMHPDGLGIGARRITVSTAGDVPGIERFAREEWQVRLSVSLHAANDALRDELVPLNRRYNLKRLMAAVDDYLARTGRQLTFEWTLLAEVNDTDEAARELVELIGPRHIHVNLIPFNPVPGTPYHAPGRKRAEAFRARLEREGISATLRLERGQDISAACGQLRRHTLESHDRADAAT